MSKTSTIGKKSVSQISRKSQSKLQGTGPPVKVGQQKPKKGLEWTLPPFSICQKPKESINWDAIKRNVIRRQAPEGEDIKGIRIILKELKGKTIPVHEFINLVSAYTSDNGAQLRACVVDDLQIFRKMCRKIYETMTQDVSDVLINEQMLTVEFYQERHDLQIEKMMRAINEIYDMAPTFDFEKYYERKERYLNFILPIPAASQLDKDSEEMSKRQQAYHRLQWLRNEGERMMEENRRLEGRLKYLKEQQEYEQQRAAEAAKAAEAKAVELQKEENKMRDALEQLNIDVEKTIIANEAQLVKSFNESNIEPLPEEVKVMKKRHKKKKSEWAGIVAKEIDTENIQDVIVNEKEAVPQDPSLRQMKKDTTFGDTTANTSFRKKSKITFSPEFNSTQTPAPSSNVVQETTINQANVTYQKPRAGPRGRPHLAPKDTWKGFI